MSQLLRHVHQVAVHSSDLERSIGFYRDLLGAEYIAKFDPPGLVFFRIGDTRILLERNAHPATVYFRVDDIQLAVAELRDKGIHLEAEPQMIFRDTEGRFGPAGHEEWMAFFRDPDDNLLAVASQQPPKS